MSFWVLRSVVELYLYVSKSLDSSYKPNYLHKYLSKWYDSIIREEEDTTPNVIINIYLKTILFDMIIIVLI
jgi:hypothetical protein